MNSPSILITDDESNIRMMLRTALELDGYAVREAANGRQALEMIAAEAPDVMLLDLNMPVLDGMAVLEQLRAGGEPIPTRVIVLTAYGSISTAVKATRLGAVDFLEKPITPADLRQAVRSVIEEPELGAAPLAAPSSLAYEPVLERIRGSMRLAKWDSAESMLTKAAEQQGKHLADYFNLLGVLYEAQKKWRLARKCYGKAMRADATYEPARTNMRRFYELSTFGHTALPVSLGDAHAHAGL